MLRTGILLVRGMRERTAVGIISYKPATLGGSGRGRTAGMDGQAFAVNMMNRQYENGVILGWTLPTAQPLSRGRKTWRYLQCGFVSGQQCQIMVGLEVQCMGVADASTSRSEVGGHDTPLSLLRRGFLFTCFKQGFSGRAGV